MIKTFVIESSFLTKREIDRIKDKAPGDFITLNESNTASEIINILKIKSFFSPKRVLILRNVLGNLKERDSLDIIKIISEQFEDDLYFFEEKPTPKSKLFEYLKQNSQYQELLSEKKLNIVEYIKKEVEREGGEISPLAAERLGALVGTDFWRLSEEIKKLVNFKFSDPENKTIETSDVSELVSSEEDLNIFNLIDAFATKNLKKAATLLDDFITQGTNELYLLAMLSKQFRNITLAKFEPRIDEQTLVQKAKVHPYVAKKSIAQAKYFTKAELLTIYQKLIDADLKIKKSYDARTVLFSIII